MAYFDSLSRIRFTQYISTLSATVFLTCVGLYTSWSSLTIPRLTSNDSPIGITLTPSEASLVAASFQLGYLPGGILSGWVVSKYGPKSSILTSTILLCCPWIVVIFAKSALTLCVARFVGGFGASIVATAVPIYNSEVADKDIRGRLGSTFTMLIITGNLIAMSIGPFISYTALAIVCFLLPFTFATLFWFMPESPYYLVKAHQENVARNNIRRLCSQNSDEDVVQQRLEEVSKTIEYDMKNKASFRELFTNPIYRKPLIIMTGIKLIQQSSGVAPIDVYMQTIIKSSNSSISPEYASIIFGNVQLLAVLVTAALVDRAGRKPILIISALGSSLAMSIEGLYFYLYHNTENSIDGEQSMLPMIGLVLYLIMYPFGLGTLFYVLIGEIFPTNIKSHACSLYTVLYGVLGFIFVSSFEPISRVFGMHVPFFMYSAAAILGAIFISAVLPETKRKTFLEIQSILRKS